MIGSEQARALAHAAFSGIQTRWIHARIDQATVCVGQCACAPKLLGRTAYAGTVEVLESEAEPENLSSLIGCPHVCSDWVGLVLLMLDGPGTSD